ncbi:hypothetical protein [Aquibaculum sediminis]|uniref:hypothetical protein n=1 Tax=Aquibaculum sediminis TaxID=3231907 RepID=UPI003451AA01
MRLGLAAGLVAALLLAATAVQAQRETLPLSPEALEDVPKPPAMDLPEMDLESLGGIFQAIEDIAGGEWVEAPDYDDWRLFINEWAEDAVLPPLVTIPVVWGWRAHGDWSSEHSGQGQLTGIVFRDRVQLIAPLRAEGFDFPHLFWSSVPNESPDIFHALFHHAEGRGGTGLEAISDDLFASERFRNIPREQLHAGTFESLTGDSIFEGPETRVDGGRVRVDQSHAAGPAIQFTAYVSEYADGVDVTPQPTGRRAEISGYICPIEVWEAVPDFCQPGLRVDAVQPPPGRENVNYHDPGIAVTFSEPVDPDSLENGFRLYTRAADGEELEVEGRWEQGDGPTNYRFEATGGFEMRSGIVMAARIAGGEEGVTTTDGERWLQQDEPWRFSTLLNMAKEDNPQDFSGRLHSFQVVRDAPLTRGKPSLTRLYLDWQFHDDIDENWQPRSYPTRLQITPDHPRLVGQYGILPREAPDVVRIWRDEEFGEERRRLAEHTVNFFGWKPERGTREIVVKARAHEPFPSASAADEGRIDKSVEVWRHDPAPHTLHFTAAMVGSWRDGIPAGQWRRMLATLDAARVMAPQFFPYRSVRARSASFILLDDEAQNEADSLRSFKVNDLVFGTQPVGEEASSSLLHDALENDALMRLLGWDEVIPEHERRQIPNQEEHAADFAEQVRKLMVAFLVQLDRLARTMSPNDTFLVFVPSDFMDALGVGVGSMVRAKNDPGVFVVPGMRAALVAIGDEYWRGVDDMAQVLLHELGHEHGLAHNPGDADRIPPGMKHVSPIEIEAWRMDPGGLSGFNKSSSEGNGEHRQVLVPMMWPYMIPTREMSMTDAEYRTLLRSIEGGTDAVRFGSAAPLEPYRVAAAAETSMVDLPQAPAERLVLRGRIAADGETAEFTSLDLSAAPQPANAEGPYRAQLLDERGAPLAEVTFGLYDPLDPEIWGEGGGAPEALTRWFSVSLPWRSAAASLVVSNEGRELLRLEAPAQAPSFAVPPQVLAEDANALFVGWRMQDPDLTYDLAYSPNGTAPWQGIAFRQQGNAALLPRALLEPGLAPTLRVTVHDGLRFQSATLSLAESLVPEIRLETLPDGAALAEGAPLTLAYTAPLGPQELERGLRLVDAQGDAVAARFYTNPAAKRASFFLPAGQALAEPLTLELAPELGRLVGLDGRTVSRVTMPTRGE